MNISELSPGEQKLFQNFMGHPCPHSINELTLYHMLPAYIFMEIYKTCGIKLEEYKGDFGRIYLISTFAVENSLNGAAVLKRTNEGTIFTLEIYDELKKFTSKKDKDEESAGNFYLKSGYRHADHDGKFVETFEKAQGKLIFTDIDWGWREATGNKSNIHYLKYKLLLGKEIIEPILLPGIEYVENQDAFSWTENLRLAKLSEQPA